MHGRSSKGRGNTAKASSLTASISDQFPMGLIIVFLLSLISMVYLFKNKTPEEVGLSLWSFTDIHTDLYEPQLVIWNEQVEDPELKVQTNLIHLNALRRRLLAGVFSRRPLPDMMEVTQMEVQSVFRGPIEAVPFYDLTDRLKEEGIYDKINQPSFSPWSTRGRIFGVPHDVHPVLLTYRADIIEAAGIDMSQVETWHDFFRKLEPLAKDLDGDGRRDRFAFLFSHGNQDDIQTLMMQAGCRYFDDLGQCIIDSTLNARTIAKLAQWSSNGKGWLLDGGLLNQGILTRVLDGDVLAWIAPDWRNHTVKKHLSGLSGKVKLMPLPAWEPGGRRTSVLGGTMMGIPKTSQHIEEAWKVVKHLYCDRNIARELYRVSGIITPINEFWDDPVFAEPDPFFCGQKTGLLYVEQAPHVPIRESSPYGNIASTSIQNVIIRMKSYIEKTGENDIRVLTRLTLQELKQVKARIELHMKRDAFFNEASNSEEGDEA